MIDPNSPAPLDDAERTRCEIWTRVMGYHRPLAAWNRGKQQEHRERRQFRESTLRSKPSPRMRRATRALSALRFRS